MGGNARPFRHRSITLCRRFLFRLLLRWVGRLAVGGLVAAEEVVAEEVGSAVLVRISWSATASTPVAATCAAIDEAPVC